MIKVIDFYADWCGPCKMMDPILKELEKELHGKVEFKQVDVDAEQDKAQEYGVLSIPTFVIIKDGEEVDRIVGAHGKSQFKQLIEVHL